MKSAVRLTLMLIAVLSVAALWGEWRNNRVQESLMELESIACDQLETLTFEAGKNTTVTVSNELDRSITIKLLSEIGIPLGGRTFLLAGGASRTVEIKTGLALRAEENNTIKTCIAIYQAVETPGSVGITVALAGKTPEPRPIPEPKLGPIPCGITGSSIGLHEGRTDLNLNLEATGTVKGVMLFVNFSDTNNSQSTHELFDHIADASAFLSEMSYGKLNLQITPIHTWYRMSKLSTEYDLGVGAVEYIGDAMRLADTDVDFSQYEFVAIATVDEAKLNNSSRAFTQHKGAGINIDETEIRRVIVFGGGWIPREKERVFVHEFGHLLGLPDLYTGGFDPHYYAGEWDFMGLGNNFMAWHRYKLGWLNKNQLVCVRDGQQEHTLTPLFDTDGLKAIVAPMMATDGSAITRAMVAEVRTKEGVDARPGHTICAEGVLVYEVWTTIQGYLGPIRVKGRKTPAGTCGQWGDYVPLQVGESTTTNGVTVEVLSKSGDNYRVRVSR